MRRTAWAVLIVVVLGLAAVGYYYYYWLPGRTPPPMPVPPPAAAPALPPVAAPSPAPAIRHPIEAAPAAAPLPDLAESDPAIIAALRDMLGRKALELFFTDGIIHRVVATVDALPRPRLPVAVRPLKPAPDSFLAVGKGEELAIAAANAQRYAPYVALARAVDAHRLVGLYRRFYPLFQQAYRDLGYPKGYFNDRLVEAIDDLIAAPVAPEPVRLVQPKVLYQFADPDLEARSAGQKIMMRMGAANAEVVRQKLREIRAQLVGAAPGARP
jgi:Protein of unknown function (DUF3014)